MQWFWYHLNLFELLLHFWHVTWSPKILLWHLPNWWPLIVHNCISQEPNQHYWGARLSGPYTNLVSKSSKAWWKPCAFNLIIWMHMVISWLYTTPGVGEFHQGTVCECTEETVICNAEGVSLLILPGVTHNNSPVSYFFCITSYKK